ncbi:hypothetical protein HN371_02355 [Candidatus Poribacteria bacterium]|jgi:hypothetical protein|nr:hypothetical protein [Candidatus Poribacteria bacterium]MBT5537016.1 hypothetical protein [Candidatus Poribacteria bacterium]MBT5712889.1 hypothetical protein [Candidatus Poribacteria bacterium]MBT7099459.1 hypothetical protein [Candidatus Poribacteria bacterium]MBT7804990.1 hypothetical protein [Candidatus Poribacteria bacterium]
MPNRAYMEWRQDLERRANATIGPLIAENPGYAVDAVQPEYRGGTNIATFGTRGGEAVVYKYFGGRDRWRNELYCLEALASTGHVPKVLASRDHLIVMTCLRGSGFGWGDLDAAGVRTLSQRIGHAFGVIVTTHAPPASDGYSPADFACIPWGRDLAGVIARYVALCRGVQETLPAFQTPFFTASLDLVESRADELTTGSPTLFHDDVWNMSVDGDAFVGFFDFEMCRQGPDHAQLGCALALCSPDEHDYGLDWGSCLRGYEDATGRHLGEDDHVSILAMGHFYHHSRMCRWGAWDGDLQAADHMRASAAAAGRHLDAMRRMSGVVEGWADLHQWFPTPEA